MTPQAWRQVGELFHEAVAIPPGERTIWATRACAGDEELFRELASLLASDRKARDGFVHDQVKAGLVGFYEREARAREPERAGPYRLVREIGKGGMGTVYLGQRDDQEYHIDVAVKLVTPGMDTSFVLQRFRRERQILASLDHPHIARLLDGGTIGEDLPYIVMEYVDGVRISEYCRQRELTVEQRLRLFLDVCSAVEHAHRHFVVHRDLKPGNILVTNAGVVKLLDFGICKLLYSDPVGKDTATEAGRLMTPDYASPEQIRGEPVTVVSDVYSLAAVLYELLTGTNPHRFANRTLLEIERTICEQPVVRPSRAAADKAFARRLSGDLDTILFRALDKAPERRYPTVEEFAADLQRHLSNVPVKAVPDTLAYRAAKFLRRRGRAVTVVGAIAAAMLAGVLIVNREAGLTNDRLRIDLAAADVRIGRLYFAQHDRTRAAAAYAEAERVAQSLARPAQPEPALDALQSEMKKLKADLTAPDPR
jgi:hypothetical protein